MAIITYYINIFNEKKNYFIINLSLYFLIESLNANNHNVYTHIFTKIFKKMIGIVEF